MRIDYTLVSQSLLAPPHRLRIARADVLGHDIQRHSFCGSDHCPIVLVLLESPPAAAATTTASVAPAPAPVTTAVAGVDGKGEGDGKGNKEEGQEEGGGEDGKVGAPAAAATTVVDLSQDDE